MIKIRMGTFETNSSSTHSIVICTKKQMDDWKADKIRFDPWREKFTEKMSAEEEQRIREEAPKAYEETHTGGFYKKWEELDSASQEEWIESQMRREHANLDNVYSYNDYRCYYQENCEYTEKYFTTEHGDEICSFGKGGYDG